MNKNYKNMDCERPYERCIKYGPGILSDAELLAIIIRSGTNNVSSIELAKKVLNLHPVYHNLLGLNMLTYNELISISGIGKVKAIQLLCICELSKRIRMQKKEQSIKFNRSKDVAEYFMDEMRNLETEHLIAIYLDSKGKMINYQTVFVGTISLSIANPREILRLALKYDASNIIVLHNHPSGDPTPSKEDIESTNKLSKASNIIGIPLLDHIIIGDNQYTSLGEYGYV